VKEHNAIVAKLASAYPKMDYQQLYDKARMINAAVIAKIQTIEATPALLPNKNLATAMYANWQVCADQISAASHDAAATSAGHMSVTEV